MAAEACRDENKWVKRLTLSAFIAAAALTLCGNALASGGNVVFDGGTPAEQANVKAALNASTFNWNVLPQAITVHIGSYADGGDATAGNVYVDASLLDSGQFAWGVVQHEFGHQVDFFLLNDAQRAQLLTALGGVTWWPADNPDLTHAQYGCERFASTLAWAYWQSPANSMAPARVGGESGGMAPAAFRTLLAGMLGQPAPVTAKTVNQRVAAPAVSSTKAPKRLLKRASSG